MNELKELQWSAYQTVAYGIIAQSLQGFEDRPLALSFRVLRSENVCVEG